SRSRTDVASLSVIAARYRCHPGPPNGFGAPARSGRRTPSAVATWWSPSSAPSVRRRRRCAPPAWPAPGARGGSTVTGCVSGSWSGRRPHRSGAVAFGRGGGQLAQTGPDLGRVGDLQVGAEGEQLQGRVVGVAEAEV